MVKVPLRPSSLVAPGPLPRPGRSNFFPPSWPNRATASGNGSLQKPTADWIDGRFAAVGNNRDANSAIGRETDPRAAIVSAPILFEDPANKLIRSHRPSRGVARHRTVRQFCRCMKLLKHFAGEKSRFHLRRQELRQIRGRCDQPAGRCKPLPERMLSLSSRATAAVASRKAKLVVNVDPGSLELEGIAHHLLQKLVERFAGGTFQRMPQQPKSEV